MNIRNTKYILIVLATLLLSCERNGDAVQSGYQNATRNTDARTRANMNRLTRNGRTFPSADRLNSEVSNPGDICYECDHSSNPVSRSRRTGRNSNLCRHYRKFKSSGVPEKALKQALYFHDKNSSKFGSSRYISIADYSASSSRKRFYILDLQTGRVQKERVSHGSGSRGTGRYRTNSKGRRVEIKDMVGDRNHDGMLDRCHHGSNHGDRKNMTRGGFFKTKNYYKSGSSWPSLTPSGHNGMRMEGLSPNVNGEALGSGVVMHAADYNSNSGNMGRSYGCPAFTESVGKDVMSKIVGGSLFYSYVPQCGTLQGRVDRQVSGWQGMCN